MTSECRITRRAPGKGALDPVTLEYATPAPVVVYEGRCKVQDTRPQVNDAASGDRLFATASNELHLPVGAVGSAGVRRDDDVVITVNVSDPGLVGARYVVRGPHRGTAKSARRLPVEEVVHAG